MNPLQPANEVFEAQYAAQAEREDAGHYLCQGRRGLMMRLLDWAGVRPPDARVLDVGCGTGYYLRPLSALGAGVTGVETCSAAIAIARSRGIKAVAPASAEALPFADATFDVVLSLDVYEHIADDATAIAESFRVLKPGGAHIVMVPASRLLWGWCDTFQGHHRRYDRRELRERLAGAGFDVRLLSPFLCALYPPALAVRLAMRLIRTPEDGTRAALRQYALPPRWLNTLLASVIRWEAALITRTGLPFGVSMAAVAMKPGGI